MAVVGTLGEVLREARTRSGLSLRGLAKKLSITPSYICDVENDWRVPSEEVLRELAHASGLSLDHLMALAGRLGDQAERYLKHHPTAGVLFRSISDKRLTEAELQRLVEIVDRMGRTKSG